MASAGASNADYNDNDLSFTLSIGKIHIKLSPTSPPSSSLPSSSSAVVSVRMIPKKTSSKRLDSKPLEQNSVSAGEYDIAADLSGFSGTLHISSSSAGIGKVETKGGTSADGNESTALEKLERSSEDINEMTNIDYKIEPTYEDIPDSTYDSPYDVVSVNRNTSAHLIAGKYNTNDESEEFCKSDERAIDPNNLKTGRDDSLGCDFVENQRIHRQSEECITTNESITSENFFEEEDNFNENSQEKDGRSDKNEMTNLKYHRRKAQLRNMMGNRSVPQLSTTTELHAACASPNSKISTLESILKSNPSLAYTQDAFGELPIHVFARNERLLLAGTISNRNKNIKNFVRQLIEISPLCMLAPCIENGHVPFVSAIANWVSEVHEDANYVISTQHVDRLEKKSSNMNIKQCFAMYSMDEQRRMFLPLNGLSVPPTVVTSFDILSFVLELVHTKNIYSSVQKRKKAYPSEDYHTMRDFIVEDVSSIPLFCKTLLFVSSDRELHSLFQKTIIRNAFLHKNSVGPWILAMLQIGTFSIRRSIQYLEFVSDMTIDDFVGFTRQWYQSDVDLYLKNRKETFEAFAGITDVCKALRLVKDKHLFQVTSSHIVHYTLDRRIRRPMTLASLILDLLLHLTLISSYRYHAVDRNRDVFGDNLVYVAPSCLLLREILSVISFAMTSKSLVWAYFRDGWNVIGALTLTIVVITLFFSLNEGNLLSITVTLLWLKIIGFLKTLNMHLSTFISSFFKILKEMRWFIVVLVVTVFLFADVTEITMQGTEGLCSSDQSERFLDAQNDFCSSSSFDSIVRIYAILIGDVNLDDFRQSTMITILFILFTFFTIIVLLNVLIAIVTDAYANALLKGRGVFGCTRVRSLARQDAREGLIHSVLKPVAEETNISAKILNVLKRMVKWIARTSLVFTIGFLGPGLVSMLIEYHETLDVNQNYIAYIMTIATSILYFAYLPMVVMLFLEYIFGDKNFYIRLRTTRVFKLAKYVTNLPVKVFYILLGSEGDLQQEGIELSAQDDWSGQLRYFEQRTKQVVNESEDRLKMEVRDEVEKSEERQISHLKRLEAWLKSEIQVISASLTQG